MQVSVERRPGSVVALDIEVPSEQVERAIERAYSRLAPQVKIPGFRPGKAPRNLVEQRIGWPALREQAIEILVPEAVTEAVTEQRLDAIETPRVQVDTFERLQPAKFKAEVTVKPEVVLGDYRAIRAPLPEVEVGERHVEEAVDSIRERFGELVPAGSRPVQDGDHVVVDLEVLRDGAPVDDQPSADQQLDVKADQLIPGLHEGLVGMAQGETRDIPLTLPEDYRRTELAGKDVVFRVTVKEVKEHVLPPVDDELARLSGLGQTLDELRQELESRLRAVAQRDATFKQQKDALDALVAQSTADVPEVLVHEEIDREIRNLALDLQQQGLDFERLVEYGGVDLEKMHEEARPRAVDRVRQELALEALADAEHLDPSEAHLEAEARRTLAGSEDSERLVGSDRVRAYVRERLRLQWALLWLAANARGEAWAPPTPEELAAEADLAATAAAGEVLEAPGLEAGSAPVIQTEPAASPVPEEAVPDETGMVEI